MAMLKKTKTHIKCIQIYCYNVIKPFEKNSIKITRKIQLRIVKRVQITINAIIINRKIVFNDIVRISDLHT